MNVEPRNVVLKPKVDLYGGTKAFEMTGHLEYGQESRLQTSGQVGIMKRREERPRKLEGAFVYSSSLIRVLSLLVYDMRQKYTETTHLLSCTGALSYKDRMPPTAPILYCLCS
jgi:hypothetical protein